MNYIYINGELYHFGIKGMKWGVRRSPKVLDRLAGRVKQSRENERAYRDKLSAIQNKQTSTHAKLYNASDLERFKYRNQSLAARVAKTAGGIVAGKLVSDVLTGKIHTYSSMSKKQLAKELTSVAARTGLTVAAKDALAKSASKRYSDTGKKIKKSGTLLTGTKEDMIERSVKAVALVAPVFAVLGKMKLSQVRAQQAENEARFKRWGKNILPEKAGVIVLSDSEWTEIK